MLHYNSPNCSESEPQPQRGGRGKSGLKRSANNAFPQSIPADRQTALAVSPTRSQLVLMRPHHTPGDSFKGQGHPRLSCSHVWLGSLYLASEKGSMEPREGTRERKSLVGQAPIVTGILRAQPCTLRLTGGGRQAARREAVLCPHSHLRDPCKCSCDPLNAGRSGHVASGSTL